MFYLPENLGKHIKHHNLTREDYYIKWNKKHTHEGICPCGNKTVFLGVNSGYRKYCSSKCKREGAGKETSKTWNIRKSNIKETYKFNCLDCKEKFETSLKLNLHIIKYHGKKQYYDNYLKKENEGFCKICNKPTKFSDKLTGKYFGYEYCCSKKCGDKYRLQNRTKTNLEKYGVKNPFESKEVQKKIKEKSHYC